MTRKEIEGGEDRSVASKSALRRGEQVPPLLFDLLDIGNQRALGPASTGNRIGEPSDPPTVIT